LIGLQNIPVDLIEPGRRLRELNEGQIKRLQASILDIGLLNPITVYERPVIQAGVSVDGYGLVAGGHRLAAYKMIGYEEIPACIVELTDLERQIAECDENLCGPKLSASEEAWFIKRRKDAYEALHPETRNGAVGNGREKVRQVGEATSDKENKAVDRFTADTAAKTGQSERAVQRAAERGEKVIDEALSIVRGTKLDTGVYLDKLKKLSPNDQVTAAKRDLAIERQRAEEPRPRGGLGARYQQAAPDPAKSAERFVSLADQIEAIPIEELLSSGRMRATVGQRASGLADHLSEIVERLDR
jgi:ParB-like chromosome segregation protein Spo0J